MNQVQRKAFQLLLEFDDICKKNKLRYFLGPRVAARSLLYGGFDDALHNLQVFMPVKDCMKFIHIVDKDAHPGRAIEYMGNSKNYTSFSVIYVDETSTYINLKRGTDFDKYGIKITIQLLRKDVKYRIASFLEFGWEINGYSLTKKLDLTHLISFVIVRCLMIIGRKNIAKMLFQYFCNKYAENDLSKSFFVRTFKEKRIFFDSGFFADNNTIEFECHHFPIPQKLEEYLQISLGVNWRERVENSKVADGNIIKMADVPYVDYINALKRNGLSLKKVFAKQRKSWITGVFALRYIKSYNMAWLIACRSGDRLRFYEEFSEKQKEITMLYKEHNYAELNKIFMDHEKQAKFYLKRGLGLCVSKEILNIQCELLNDKGESETANKLRLLAPKEHNLPIK